MNAVEAMSSSTNAASAAGTSGFSWDIGAIGKRLDDVIIGVEPSSPPFKWNGGTFQTKGQDASGTDFWARLSHVELESRTSKRSSPDSWPPDGMPVCSEIDEGDTASQAVLTAPVKRLAPIMHAIIASKASRTGLRINQPYFDVDRDDEENTRQLVVIFPVIANGAQALAFWNSLDYEMDRWLAQLTLQDRDIVTTRLGLRFVWDGSADGR